MTQAKKVKTAKSAPAVKVSPKEIMNTRNLQHRMEAHAMGRPPAFHAVALRTEGRFIDPFLMTDHFWMSVPHFPPHPHAGFSAVTYMFEDSAGSFLNRDSLGDHTIIRPGDLHWTLAGSGVVHEETPTESGVFCHGLQIFVNLAAEHKFSAPGSQQLASTAMPVSITAEGTRVKVVAGRYQNERSPLHSTTNITMLDVQLAAQSEFVYEAPADWNVFVIQVKGATHYGADAQLLNEREAAVFTHEAEASRIVAHTASEEAAHFFLFAGQPLREPVVMHGPFAMNTQAQIVDTIAAYQRGDMGMLEPSF